MRALHPRARVPGNNPSNPNTPRACPFCLNSNPSGGGSAAARQAPLHRFEEVCKLPIDIGLFFFACANAGVTLRPPGPMSVAVLLALVVGKSAGITGMALLATKARHRPRPSLDCLASRREFASSYVVRRASYVVVVVARARIGAPSRRSPRDDRDTSSDPPSSLACPSPPSAKEDTRRRRRRVARGVVCVASYPPESTTRDPPRPIARHDRAASQLNLNPKTAQFVRAARAICMCVCDIIIRRRSSASRCPRASG